MAHNKHIQKVKKKCGKPLSAKTQSRKTFEIFPFYRLCVCFGVVKLNFKFKQYLACGKGNLSHLSNF